MSELNFPSLEPKLPIKGAKFTYEIIGFMKEEERGEGKRVKMYEVKTAKYLF
jgi:hypothetical protein